MVVLMRWPTRPPCWQIVLQDLQLAQDQVYHYHRHHRQFHHLHSIIFLVRHHHYQRSLSTTIIPTLIIIVNFWLICHHIFRCIIHMHIHRYIRCSIMSVQLPATRPIRLLLRLTVGLTRPPLLVPRCPFWDIASIKIVVIIESVPNKKSLSF